MIRRFLSSNPRGGNDLCPVASSIGHVAMQTCVCIATCVRIAMCPVELATGHKRHPLGRTLFDIWDSKDQDLEVWGDPKNDQMYDL